MRRDRFPPHASPSSPDLSEPAGLSEIDATTLAPSSLRAQGRCEAFASGEAIQPGAESEAGWLRREALLAMTGTGLRKSFSKERSELGPRPRRPAIADIPFSACSRISLRSCGLLAPCFCHGGFTARASIRLAPAEQAQPLPLTGAAPVRSAGRAWHAASRSGRPTKGAEAHADWSGLRPRPGRAARLPRWSDRPPPPSRHAGG